LEADRIAAAAHLICALTAASPALYLSPVVAVGLKLRHEKRRLIRDNVGNK